MTTPLTDQIREYFADVEVQQGAVDVAALLERESSRLRTVDDAGTPTTPVRARWWVGLVAAAAVVALVAGLVIIRSVDADRDDDVVPTVDDGTSPVTSDGSPESVPSTDPETQPTVESAPDAGTTVTVEWPAGEVESSVRLLDQEVTPSSIGDLRWAVYQSPAGADSPTTVWRGPQGYVSVRDQQLNYSDDAVTWRVVDEDFPGSVVGLSRDQSGQYHLIVRTPDGPFQNWQSPDLETWQLQPDGSDFADWVDGPGLVYTKYDQYTELPDGGALARVTFGLDMSGQIARRVADEEDLRLFARNPSEVWSTRSETDDLAATVGAAVITTTSWSTWEDAKAESVATVEVMVSTSGTPDAWALEVEDPETGEALGTVRGSIGGSSLGRTLRALANGDLEAWFYIEGGTAELVQPEWTGPSDPDPSSVLFVTTTDGLVAYVGAGPGAAPGAAEVWRRTDGRTWENLGSPAGWPDDAGPSEILATPDGGFVAVFRGPQTSLLTSDDAINWQPASQLPASLPHDSMLRLTDSGFVLAGLGDQTIPEVWTSPDGDVWESVDVAGMFSELEEDLVYTGSGSDASTPDLFTMTRDAGGRSITWLVEVVQ